MMRDCLTNFSKRLASAAHVAAVFFCASSAVAESVTVTSASGGLQLRGDVIGYDGRFLQLGTDYGTLTLDYAAVLCEGAACPDPDNYVPHVRVSGAARLTEVLLPAMVDAFARSQGWQVTLTETDQTHFDIALADDAGKAVARFSFRATSTDEGFADLIAYESDIALALREIRPDEATLARAAGLGDLADPRQARIVGLDALVPVVHPGLPIDEMSLDTLARVFRGLIDNWAEVGGPDLPIVRQIGPASNGQMQFFVDHLITPLGGTLAQDVQRHADLDAVATAVANTPGSLAVLPVGETGDTKQLTLRDACGFTSVPATTTLKAEDYPLTEPLSIYLPDRRQAAIVRQFLRWLRGPEAQLVVRRAGFVDQGAVPIALDQQGQRFVNAIANAGPEVPLTELQRMVRVLTPRTRLSTSFRFQVGSTRLDAQSRSNLLALGQAIRDGRYAGQSLMLVGFSDGRGDALANRDLASARAEAVKRALLAAMGSLPDDVVVETEAFGEALPMGCDDTEWGRQMNRRVELWVDQSNP